MMMNIGGLRRRSIAALALSPLAVLGMATALFDPASQLERDLAAALAATGPVVAGTPAALTRPSTIAEAGTEAFWLGHGAEAASEANGFSRVTLEGPFKPRDLVEIDRAGLRGQVYEVVSLARAEETTTRIDTAAARRPQGFVLTARLARDPAAPLVAIPIDGQGKDVSLVRHLDRAL
ncbi:MAG: hypothetical protein NW216_08210 [Hyphomicrobium sp.]|nr:hypothetical protein [Hyphomicrobium sp.]